ncbi:DUF4249 domain-containing protein [Algoriphagus sanaruensis]|uniref:DUF4249 domain-containing protein n=1 Tax=Algoriphagus sanaruensis TaxID=1727163 RepID=A0A142EKS2_9BACT|nr:DUF4249 domain-containing protein [Algoriphagus sanaruensis]AMQ55727.1 hypothetical protein AO498_04865 [Algoriphagus sanaruensis]
MINRLAKTCFLLVMLLAASCVEQISFPIDKLEKERLIVSGGISDLDEPQVVFLSVTTSEAREPEFSGGYFTLNDLPRPVRNATVSVRNEQNGAAYFFRETLAGRYELAEGNLFSPGESYFLQIEIAGQTYRSRPQVMPEIIGSDLLSYEFDQDQVGTNPEVNVVKIRSQVTLPEANGNYYLRWSVDEAYYWDLTFFPNPFNIPPPQCYVFDFPDPERITLLDGDLVNNPGGEAEQLLAVRLVDQSFLSRHYFNVRQLSISEEAFTYWGKIRTLVNNTGSVFDTPPAPVRGNLYNVNDPEEVVLGFFEVAKGNMTRIYTTRADVPFFLEKVCEYLPNKRRDQYEPTCLSCSVFPNSTNTAPKWWFDQ